MSDARRRHPPYRPRVRGWRDVPATAVGTLLTVLVLATSACGNDARTPRAERPDVGSTQGRRGVGEREVDTTSLLSPTRNDSLIGDARGAGGIESLQAQCLVCHEGAHDARLGRGAGASATCAACHRDSHAAIQDFYAGTIRQVAVPADTMYLARVSCAGCHTDSTFAIHGGGNRLVALNGMCVSCHGPRFDGMLARWRGGLAWRELAVASYIAQADADPRLSPATTKARLRDARATVSIVRTAGAVHNIRGADQLLRAAIEGAASAYARAGIVAPPPPQLGPDPRRNDCVSCHYGIEASRTTMFGATFDHGAHVVRASVACTECHSDANYFVTRQSPDAESNREVDRRHGKTRVTAGSCDGCHHSPTSQLACTSCHAGDARLDRPRRVTMALALRPQGAPNNRLVDFQHAQHTAAACTSCHATARDVRTVVSCSQCHTDHHRERATGCVTCHGTRMLDTHARDSHLTCANCHAREVFTRLLPDRTFCTSCHVKQSDHVPGRECSPCHLNLTPDQVRQRILSSPASTDARED